MTIPPYRLAPLVHHAVASGATAAVVIDAADIVLSVELAALCNADACERYGQAPSCPPVIGGPEDFRRRFDGFSAALVIRIDVPTEMLLSSLRRDVMQLLHEVAADTERKARAMGWARASALAGGSCKYLFCFDAPDCPLLSEAGPCRHPDRARPSMSGFGIDVTRLMASAGWEMSLAGDDDVSVAPVVALVLLGGDVHE